MSIADGLHFDRRFGTFEAHFLGRSLDITTLGAHDYHEHQGKHLQVPIPQEDPLHLS